MSVRNRVYVGMVLMVIIGTIGGFVGTALGAPFYFGFFFGFTLTGMIALFALAAYIGNEQNRKR